MAITVILTRQNDNGESEKNNLYVKNLMSSASSGKKRDLEYGELTELAENSMDPEKSRAMGFYIFRKFGKESTLSDIRVLKLCRILLFLMVKGNLDIWEDLVENEHLVQGFMSENEKRGVNGKR